MFPAPMNPSLFFIFYTLGNQYPVIDYKLTSSELSSNFDWKRPKIEVVFAIVKYTFQSNQAS